MSAPSANEGAHQGNSNGQAMEEDGKQEKAAENVVCDNNLNMANVKAVPPALTNSGQSKVILCQSGQLLLSFTPASVEQILLLKGNLATTGELKQPKVTINLNPANKISAASGAPVTGVPKPATVGTATSNAGNTSSSSSATTSGSVSASAASDACPTSKQKVGDSIYVCSFKGCGRSFPSLSLLSCHQAVHKSQSKKADLVCQICKLKFAWPSHYKYHLLTHNNERAYECYVEGCGKRFYTMQRLDVHLRSHTGERPFRCDQEGCGKSFTTKGNLRNHQRIHTGEKPYKCTHEGCTSAFAEFSSLRKHKLVHSGEKPFACEFCDKVFSQSGSRNIHMNKNHAARKQHAITINGPQQSAETAVSATIDSAMVVESPQNILVLTHYDDKMLHYQEQGSEHVVTVSTHSSRGNDPLNLSHSMLNPEESLQAEVESLGSRSNVVVLSQPEELASMGEAYQSATHEEIVYDNDILNSDLDQDQMASSSLSIQQDLENESNESHASSDQMIVSILDSSAIKKKVF